VECNDPSLMLIIYFKEQLNVLDSERSVALDRVPILSKISKLDELAVPNDVYELI
jgi:hypothetical protein